VNTAEALTINVMILFEYMEVHYFECQPKSKKWGRPGNEAR